VSEDQASAGDRALRPFGQVPEIETDDLKLFARHQLALNEPRSLLITAGSAV